MELLLGLFFLIATISVWYVVIALGAMSVVQIVEWLIPGWRQK